MSEDAPTRRRCFRFSLWTLFVVMTVVAFVFAHHVKWIRQRHRFLAEELLKQQERRPGRGVYSPPHAPGLLWLFGESGVDEFYIVLEANDFQTLTSADIARVRLARSLFPETAHIGILNSIPKNSGKGYLWSGPVSSLDEMIKQLEKEPAPQP